MKIERSCVFVSDEHHFTLLPAYWIDEKGFFLLCNSEELEKEAQQHFDQARESCIEGVGHAAGAGLTIEFPPIAIFEGYQAVQAFKKMGEEYVEGHECQERANEERQQEQIDAEYDRRDQMEEGSNNDF